MTATTALAILVASCGAADDAAATPSSTTRVDVVTPPTTPPAPPPTTQPPDTTTTPPTTVPGLPPGVDPTENPQVRFAIADLAAMLGVPEDSIAVVVWEEVVWPDGAIGCPQPGFSYTQALVDGTRIVLEHDGTRYGYHAAGLRDPFFCAKPAP